MLESIAPHKTAGQIHNELSKKESEKASEFDLGYAFADQVFKEVVSCIERHYDVFGEHVKRYCVVCVLCPGEGNLKYLLRRKFYGWPYLPVPMPNQSVWMYDKETDICQFLWSLPTPQGMAELSEGFSWELGTGRLKTWSDLFYKGHYAFWEGIRKMHGITMLSEEEFNRRNREKGGKLVQDDFLGLATDSSYLPEMRIKKLEAAVNPGGLELLNNRSG